jgi:tetratricopeptide (TPR) repeat protein
MNWLSRLLGRKDNDSVAPIMEPPAKPSAPALELRSGSPECDAFIAKTSLGSGHDLAHGAQHLAELLAIDPARAEWRALIERYAAAAGPDTDTLIPERDRRFAATEALRAYLWNMRGRTADAVGLLVDVSQSTQDPQYLHAWVLEWLEPDGAVECLDDASAQALFGTILVQSDEAHVASVAGLHASRRWAQLLERSIANYEPAPVWIMIRAGLHRKAGNFDGALAITGPIETAASFSHAAAIGLAYRRKGMYDESEAAFVRALEIEPENNAGRLEAGDTLFEAGAWARARDWYNQALGQDPDNSWATASAIYSSFKLTGERACLDQLDALAQAGNERARRLWLMEAWELPESGDASANVLRQLRDKFNDPATPNTGGINSLGLSTLEAPSNRLAFALELAALGLNPLVKFTVASIPVPDPRVPAADVRYCLWRYEGATPMPALPAPSPAVYDAIAELAQRPFDPGVNWAQASHVADRLGVSQVAQILAVMVHPSPMPAGLSALQWLPRLQLAAAQVVGQIDTGWEHSERRKALRSLLLGPRDWTTCAAIRVMGRIAITEPAYAMDIHESFIQLERLIPSEGHWDWIALLYEQWQTIPYLFDAEREALKAKLEAMEFDADD